MKASLLLLLLTVLALAACKKDSDDSDQPGSTADFFFLAQLDAESVRLEMLPDNDIELSTSNDGSLSAPECAFDYGTYIASSDLSKMPQVEINFAGYFDGDCADEGTAFNSLFPTGPQVFLLGGGKGVEVHVVDATGNYSSARGPQPSAQFIITKSEVANDAFGLGQSISGTVTCTLYDEFGGKKELTDGVFRLHFRSWF